MKSKGSGPAERGLKYGWIGDAARSDERMNPQTPLIALAILGTMLSGCFGITIPDLDNPGPALVYVGPRYANILIEMDIVGNADPDPRAVEDFREHLEEVLAKPVEIIVSHVPSTQPDGLYSVEEIEDLLATHRDHGTGGDRAVIHALLLDGRLDDSSVAGNRELLGTEFSGAIILFQAQIREAARHNAVTAAASMTNIRYLERAVLVHEAGHVIGLVNKGVPMVTPHEHAEYRGHSVNRGSVMHPDIDVASVMDAFEDPRDIPYRFDSNDRADLQAVRAT